MKMNREELIEAFERFYCNGQLPNPLAKRVSEFLVGRIFGDAIAPSSDDCAKPKPETDASKRYEEAKKETSENWKDNHLGSYLYREREAAAAVIRELKRESKTLNGALAMNKEHWDKSVREWRDASDRAEAAEKRVWTLTEECARENALYKEAAQLSHQFRNRADLAERRLEIAREGLETIGAYRSSSQADIANETLKRIDAVNDNRPSK